MDHGTIARMSASWHTAVRTHASFSYRLRKGPPIRRPPSPMRRPNNPLIVSAKKKKEEGDLLQNMTQSCESMQKQLEGMRSELIRLQKQAEDKKASEKMGKSALPIMLESAVNQWLDRQETFFKEEREHWIAERVNWQRQEKELREEIARLQHLLIEKQPPPTDGTDHSLEERSPSVVDEGSKRETQPSEETGCVEKLITTAMSVVDKGDVLSEDFETLLRNEVNGTPSLEKEEALGEKEELVETVKSPPTGPPPVLTAGDDDIYWVSQLQEALNQKGYFCGDDDVEDFYFGETTLSALLTFQACEGLQETGVTDPDTWQKLLGADMKPVIGHLPEEKPKEVEKEFKQQNIEDFPSEFPVLSELDGGREVHCLQVMLEIAGFSCGKDDMEWWHYGDGTIAATKTFQACNGLPESGVADENTWKALAGAGKTMADVLQQVKQENIFEEDMTNNERVWLLGEQRWERKL